ncbi:putative signal transducing protein [Allorhodopirellula heiligendammensis]|nr:DUF2007 domain-containing protein [Allorhodopirellula heiligendammensis]
MGTMIVKNTSSRQLAPPLPINFCPSLAPVRITLMQLNQPVVVYTANSNLEAQSVVTWIESHGIPAHAVEDNSGVSTFAFGTISQFHQPQVFVDQKDLAAATELLRQFEQQRDQRLRDQADAPKISSQCEQCGATSDFPASQDGTTQSCPKCHAFMDVGTFDWPEDFDFGAPESDVEPVAIDNADDALDAAADLDTSGEWDAAIIAYREISERWPEHATYTQGCIADIQRKRDRAQ